MSENIKSAAIEAVLFSAAKPISLEFLAEIFDCTELEMLERLERMDVELIDADRGIRLRRTGAGVELVSAPEYSIYVERIRKREDKLSVAAMETLAVIAFKQPVTKSEVEEVRGVNSEKVIKQLIGKHLVTELGHKDSIGRPTLYGTTDAFLRSVGITSLADLTQEYSSMESIEFSAGMEIDTGIDLDRGIAIDSQSANTNE